MHADAICEAAGRSQPTGAEVMRQRRCGARMGSRVPGGGELLETLILKGSFEGREVFGQT